MLMFDKTNISYGINTKLLSSQNQSTIGSSVALVQEH